MKLEFAKLKKQHGKIQPDWESNFFKRSREIDDDLENQKQIIARIQKNKKSMGFQLDKNIKINKAETSEK